MKTPTTQTEFKKLKSTPGMWVIFIVFLGILVGISILFLNHAFNLMTEDALPTRVFTVENDVVSIKLPNHWGMSSTSTSKQITLTSSSGYESISISKASESNVTDASIIYMLELRGLFPNANADSLAYTESDIDGKKMYVTQVMYGNRYYLCGVRESGNTIIRFVYSASVMTGEISDIDSIIQSINYREGESKY